MRGNLKSKCACSAGGIGICLCVIFMSLAVVGTAAVGISKNTEDIGKDTSDNSMSSMSSMQSSSDSSKSNASSSSQNSNVIIDFFSGVWGQVILLASFGAMFAGIWFSRDISSRKVLLPISVVGAAILYISMYIYYSIALEIIGAIILAFVYASTFSHRVAKIVKVA